MYITYIDVSNKKEIHSMQFLQVHVNKYNNILLELYIAIETLRFSKHLQVQPDIEVLLYTQ